MPRRNIYRRNRRLPAIHHLRRTHLRPVRRATQARILLTTTSTKIRMTALIRRDRRAWSTHHPMVIGPVRRAIQVRILTASRGPCPRHRALLSPLCRQNISRSEDRAKELSPRFHRTLVDYPTVEPPGTIIIDTPNTYLYLTIGHGKAIRYGIGVGREGFTWSGTEHISRMKEWPDWFPPQEMIKRQPYLPRFMAGGETNPLGARAMYLGNTQYRIHGTNQPSTIGSFVSSGCIRLTNEDVEDLYSRVTIGTTVVVLPGANTAASQLLPRR